VSSTPIWFGPAERARFGWLHAPADGRAAGGVVLCPPLGYEYACAHRTFRAVAEHLAERGLAALRFDYDGTGDSVGGDDDPDRMAAWSASIDDAVAALRDGGVGRVAVVGMRLGALLAAEAVERGPLDALVLWDPVWTGKAYLRQARTLHLLATDAPPGEETPDGALWVTGNRFSAGTVDDLAARRLPDLSATGTRTLVLRRADRPDLGARDEHLPPDRDEVPAVGQDGLLDVASSASVVPDEAVEVVVGWLADALGGPPAPLGPIGRSGPVAVGDGCTETAVHLGPLGLFGIVTEPADAGDRPTLAFLNGGTDHHCGPNRIWVDWGRRLAALGFRVARLDLSGLGDSPVRPGQPTGRSYAPEAGEDVAAAVRALDEGSGVVLLGLCSGARHALAAAAAGDPPVRGVCAFSPSLHLPDEVLHDIANTDPNPASVVALDRYRRYRSHLLRRLPKPLWRAVHTSGLGRSRATLLADAVANGTEVLVTYGADDFFLLRLRETSAWHVDRLARRPGFRLAVFPGLDHPLMAPGPRFALLDLVTEHLLARFGAPVPVEGQPAGR
jgi:alpha-beta hydrolase superfamily lysophospholipase